MGSKHLQHVLKICLGVDFSPNILQSLKYEGIESIVHFFQLTNKEMDGLELEDARNAVKPLPKQDKRQLKSLLKWVKHLHSKNFDRDWTKLSADDYDQFLSTSIAGSSAELHGVR